MPVFVVVKGGFGSFELGQSLGQPAWDLSVLQGLWVAIYPLLGVVTWPHGSHASCSYDVRTPGGLGEYLEFLRFGRIITIHVYFRGTIDPT